MDDLIEELRADQSQGGQFCKFCKWVETRPGEEQAKWEQAFLDRSFSRASLLRAAQRRGFPHKEQSIETHQKEVRDRAKAEAVASAATA